MDLRLRIPRVPLWWVLMLGVAALGVFVALDKTTLHWYVPDSSDLRAAVSRSDSQVSLLGNRIEGAEGRLTAIEKKQDNTASQVIDLTQASQIARLASAVTVLSLVSAYGGSQNTGSAAGKACMAWFLAGQGSITDCGFRHVEGP